MSNILRQYQQAAIDATYTHLRLRDDNPCIVLPTGTGKSHVIAQIVHDAVTLWGGRVLILAHVKELLLQNFEKIKLHAPDIDAGLYSAGLHSRQTDNAVIVAGIQSVYQRAGELGPFNLVIIDEAHLIPQDGDGMYQQFLADAKLVNPHVRLIGLTATPYRLKGGEICGPENALNHICYEAGLKEMIRDGYLAPLKSRNGKRSVVDLSRVSIRGGEFVADEMAEAFDKEELVYKACSEIVELTKDCKSILIFCASVAHAQHVAEKIKAFSGEDVGIVIGDTPHGERAEIVARFKGETVQADLLGEVKGPLRWLVNVRVFTTGFDARNTDCVVMLFSTASPGLYVQVVGRGTRTFPGKEHCLVLDYGQNVMRHGPVDAVVPPSRKAPSNGQQTAPAKECPACGEIIHASYQVCPNCGEKLPPPPKPVHGYHADGTPILSGEISDDVFGVSSVYYSVHTKKDGNEFTPKTLRVEYQCGSLFVSEWVCPEHTGFARNKFIAWWMARSNAPAPNTAQRCVELSDAKAIACPSEITVRHIAGERFDRVVGYALGPIPEYREAGWDPFEEQRQAETVERLTGDFDEDEIPF